MKNANDKILLVAHECEDWWDLRECNFLTVTEETRDKMGQDYQSKWWRYFDGSDDTEISTDELLDEENAVEFIMTLIQENNELRQQLEKVS